MKNPFGLRTMIQDPKAFVGRKDELEELYERLKTPASCSVVGTRRIGKSSFLYYVTLPSTYSAYLTDHESFVFAFINLQELAGLGTRDFLFTAVDRLCRASNGRLKYDPEKYSTFQLFPRFLEKAQDAGLKLVLCCDEFEALSQNLKCDASFFVFLRGMLNGYSLAMVTSSQTQLYNLCDENEVQTSEFWNIFTGFTLGLMPEVEARELITRPFARTDVTITKDDVNFMLNLAGLHPFFLQIACFHLFEEKRAEGQLDLLRIKDRFFTEVSQHHVYAWERLESEEQAALGAFVQNGQIIPQRLLGSLEQKALINKSQASLLTSSWQRFIQDQIKPSSPDRSRMPDSQPSARIWLKLQLTPLNGLDFKVRVLESPRGQSCQESSLPYAADELSIILQALRNPSSAHFTGEQIKVLKRVGLWEKGSLVHDVLERVGRHLYEALLVGDNRVALEMALAQSPRTQSVKVQLCFDKHAVELARYPWELIHDGNFHLLLSKAIELTRNISYPSPPTQLTKSLPLSLLYLAPRPANLAPLPPDKEQNNVRQEIHDLMENDELNIHELSRPTYEALLDYVDEQRPIDILHFDGHGVLARRCHRCRKLNRPYVGQCACNTKLGAISPEGHLAFEQNHPERDARWINSTILGNLLFPSSLRLAVLSACSSGEVYKNTIFDGVGPKLIQAGVPAVVATQASISVSGAIKFARGFYRALTRFESIPAAVNAGRRQLSDSSEWFIPVLYLRSQDDEGHLFVR